LTDIEFRSLVSDIDNRIEQTKTNKSENEQKIINISEDVKRFNEKEKSNKNTGIVFKKHNKIKELEYSLPQNITFGGKQTLRELTKLHNNIQVINKETDIEKRSKLLAENKLKIDKQTILWKEGRILHFYILGEANQKGNRFFDFDFLNKKIIFKPFKGKKIEIKYSCFGNNQKELLKLQEFINNKSIAVTLSISVKQICLSFDNEILSGFYIDKQKRKKEVECEIKNNFSLSAEEKKELIKFIYKKHYDELKAKKLVNKISNRYISVDMNPDYLGYCIADKGIYGIKKIIEKGVIDFRNLNKKLNLSSDNYLVKNQNNKRKFEIHNALKSLFEIANHYKVAYFVKEDIDGIGKNEKLNSKEANRKTRNIWHREITEWQIEKRCIKYGIELIPIIPVYTSFIGNLIYDYFDATNAAIEICRRGMFKYEKGLFYPPITGTIFDTMSKFFEYQNIQLKPRDVQIFKDCKKWDKLFKIASDNGLRWRWNWEMVKKPFSVFSMNSVKSKVKIIRFA
jgi:IS605 OrfB family transposase